MRVLISVFNSVSSEIRKSEVFKECSVYSVSGQGCEDVVGFES